MIAVYTLYRLCQVIILSIDKIIFWVDNTAMSKPKKRGRPRLPASEGRRENLILRLSSEERRAIVAGARREGQTVSAFIRERCLP